MLSDSLLITLTLYLSCDILQGLRYVSHNSAVQCAFTRLATSYVGHVAVTRTGLTCQHWIRQTPHAHVYTDDNLFPDGSVELASNYCRNPDAARPGGAWCYVLHDHIKWEYCDIPQCDCIIPGTRGMQYQGHVATTFSGNTCQRWDSSMPHEHEYGADGSLFPDGSVSAAKEYCRNPKGVHQVPWCFTDASTTRWQPCDIPYCNCRTTHTGIHYTGTTNTTRQGIACQRWDKQDPHRHLYTFAGLFPDRDLEKAGNSCRNPNNDPAGLWCFTASRDLDLEYCDVPMCEMTFTSMTEDGCMTSSSCRLTPNGKEYTGTTSVTVSGYTCQRWDSQYPHAHGDVVSGGENYCRNPGGRAAFPWCYTTERHARWQYCDIPLCDSEPDNHDCRPKAANRWYRGTMSVTVSGRQCQRWDTQEPHHHQYTDSHHFHGEHVSDAANFCRNVGNEQFPWCYTTDINVKWEYCDIPLCASASAVPCTEGSTLAPLVGCFAGACLGVVLLGVPCVVCVVRNTRRRRTSPKLPPRPPLRSHPRTPTATSETQRYSKQKSMHEGQFFGGGSGGATRGSAPALFPSPGVNMAPSGPGGASNAAGGMKGTTRQTCHAYLELVSDEQYLPMDGRVSYHKGSRETM